MIHTLDLGRWWIFHQIFCNWSNFLPRSVFRCSEKSAKSTRLKTPKSKHKIGLSHSWRRPSLIWCHLLKNMRWSRPWTGMPLFKILDSIIYWEVGQKCSRFETPFWSAYWRKSLAPGTVAAFFTQTSQSLGLKVVPSLTFWTCLKQFHPKSKTDGIRLIRRSSEIFFQTVSSDIVAL